MFKKLFTQIKNEWRSNLWLALEMLIVSVVLWYVVDFFYVTIYNYTLPRGFDASNCYRIGVATLTDKSQEYIADRSDEERLKDRETLLDRIRMRPEVEFVSLSINSYPYNGSNSGTSILYDTIYPRGFAVSRDVTPDFVQVFRYGGVRGETPAQLAEMLTRGEVLISDNLFMHDKIKGVDIVGEGLSLFGDTTRTYRIGASLNEVQYDDYGGWGDDFTMVYSSSSSLQWGREWCVRVKEGHTRDFIENFMNDADNLYRVGNLYITDVKSFDDIRDNFQRITTNEIRNYCVGMGFLLLNIFLGLLGTFWFRTQQRVSEIAIRMVNGATRRSIFGRLIGEGVLILTIVTVFAAAIDVFISHLELNQWLNNGFMSWGRTTACILIAYVLMAIMISIGIAFPAHRAMHIEPTEALHDE